MKEKIVAQNIDRLNISCDIIERLKKEKIITLRQLCSKNKTFLKDLGLSNDAADKIEIELQLLGLDLKTRY